MFFLIIFILSIIYFLFYKKSESFYNINTSNLNATIINNVNSSNYPTINTSGIYNLFNNIYTSYDKYESAIILFNNREIFNRFFILNKKDLSNNLVIMNKILDNHKEYNIIDPSTQNSKFWDITLNGENSFKDNIDEVIENSDFLQDVFDRRRVIMDSDELKRLFKSIFDILGPVDFNS